MVVCGMMGEPRVADCSKTKFQIAKRRITHLHRALGEEEQKPPHKAEGDEQKATHKKSPKARGNSGKGELESLWNRFRINSLASYHKGFIRPHDSLAKRSGSRIPGV